MNGVEGVGGTSWNARVTANSVRKAREEEGREQRMEAHESGAGINSGLELSRRFLSENLTRSGFMDLSAGIVTGLKTFLMQGMKEPEPVETGLDIRMAGELASLMRAEVTSEVNLVLRILARVATLLR